MCVGRSGCVMGANNFFRGLLSKCVLSIWLSNSEKCEWVLTLRALNLVVSLLEPLLLSCWWCVIAECVYSAALPVILAGEEWGASASAAGAA